MYPIVTEFSTVLANIARQLLSLIYLGFTKCLYALLHLGQSICESTEINIEGKLVVLTGGSGGLGLEMATQFLERGARVALLDVNKISLTGASAKLGEMFPSATIAIFQCDVADYDAMCDVAGTIMADRRLGLPDYLVCGAGVLLCDTVVDMPPAALQKTYDVNVFGLIWTIKSFLPAMVAANRGHIVPISSIAGTSACSTSSAYCSSKMAVNCLAECLHAELAEMGKTGVKVTTLFPVFVATPLLADYIPLTKYIPIYQPDDMARACVKKILSNKTNLFESVPGYILAMMALKYFMPQKSYEYARSFLGLKIDKKKLHS